MRERGHYDKLNAEHESARAKAAEQEASAKWEAELDARYEKRSDAITERYKNDKISSKDMMDEKRALDREKEREIRAKMKEEALARGEAYVDRSADWTRDSRGLGPDKSRERER